MVLPCARFLAVVWSPSIRRPLYARLRGKRKSGSPAVRLELGPPACGVGRCLALSPGPWPAAPGDHARRPTEGTAALRENATGFLGFHGCDIEVGRDRRLCKPSWGLLTSILFSY